MKLTKVQRDALHLMKDGPCKVVFRAAEGRSININTADSLRRLRLARITYLEEFAGPAYWGHEITDEGRATLEGKS
jgi:hypothetical protein